MNRPHMQRASQPALAPPQWGVARRLKCVCGSPDTHVTNSITNKYKIIAVTGPIVRLSSPPENAHCPSLYYIAFPSPVSWEANDTKKSAVGRRLGNHSHACDEPCPQFHTGSGRKDRRTDRQSLRGACRAFRNAMPSTLDENIDTVTVTLSSLLLPGRLAKDHVRELDVVANLHPPPPQLTAGVAA